MWFMLMTFEDLRAYLIHRHESFPDIQTFEPNDKTLAGLGSYRRNWTTDTQTNQTFSNRQVERSAAMP